MTDQSETRKRLLSAEAAVKALNARGLTVRGVEVGEGRELVHEASGRVFVDWVVPGVRRFLGTPHRRWYILVDPAGERRNYGTDYSRAVRHFEYLTRPSPDLTLDARQEPEPECRPGMRM
jgi:hypothetical protein